MVVFLLYITTYYTQFKNFNRMKVPKILETIYNSVQNGEVNNEELVQIIELAGSFLNLQTVSNCAKETGLTYNGVLKSPNYQLKELFGVKFVIENK